MSLADAQGIINGGTNDFIKRIRGAIVQAALNVVAEVANCVHTLTTGGTVTGGIFEAEGVEPWWLQFDSYRHNANIKLATYPASVAMTFTSLNSLAPDRSGHPARQPRRGALGQGDSDHRRHGEFRPARRPEQSIPGVTSCH